MFNPSRRRSVCLVYTVSSSTSEGYIRAPYIKRVNSVTLFNISGEKCVMYTIETQQKLQNSEYKITRKNVSRSKIIFPWR